MAMSHRLLGVAASLGFFGLVGGCRSIGICTTEECATELVGAAGTPTGESGLGGRAGGGAPPIKEGGGEAGDGAAGGAGAPDEPRPSLSCEPNMADCDGSRLTGCESDVTWTIRHCGACGQSCDGLCMGGRCEPTVLVQPAYAVSMVASNTTGFALVTDMFTHSLVMVDFKTASSSVLLSDVQSDTTLAVSADRVYVLDNANHELQSARLDGDDLKPEDVEWPQSIGGTAKGSYYVNIHDRTETEEPYDQTFQLHYRPKGSTAWQLLHEGSQPCRILSSSAFGLVFARYPNSDSEDEDAELSLWDGSQELALGEVPPGFVEAAAVKDGKVAILTHDDDTGVWELWWSTPGEKASHYEVPEPSNGTTAQLIVYEDTVLLYVYGDDGKAFLRSFGSDGPALARLGLLPAANVVWVNLHHVWYGVYDNWVQMRFLRSTWYDVKF